MQSSRDLFFDTVVLEELVHTSHTRSEKQRRKNGTQI